MVKSKVPVLAIALLTCQTCGQKGFTISEVVTD